MFDSTIIRKKILAGELMSTGSEWRCYTCLHCLGAIDDLAA